MTAQLKKQVRQAVGTGAAHAVNIAFGEIGDDGLVRLTENLDELRAAVVERPQLDRRDPRSLRDRRSL